MDVRKEESHFPHTLSLNSHFPRSSVSPWSRAAVSFTMQSLLASDIARPIARPSGQRRNQWRQRAWWWGRSNHAHVHPTPTPVEFFADLLVAHISAFCELVTGSQNWWTPRSGAALGVELEQKDRAHSAENPARQTLVQL